LPPYLRIAEFGEQAAGQHQVHHHPGWQQPYPLLDAARRGEDLIDHLERDELGQLAQVTRRERPRRYRDRTGYGNLIGQAEFLVLGLSWSDKPLYRNSAPPSLINTPLDSPPDRLTERR
jgi:hypothetical protein